MTNGRRESRQGDTRARILRAAQELFLRHGYHATTLQEIAGEVGITKPALYYHFESKTDMLDALLQPLTAELDEVLDEAAAAGELVALRRTLLAGWVEVFLRYRGTLFALMRELGAVRSERFEEMVLVMERAVEAAADPAGGKQERVRIAQAISAITDPVALLPGMSDEDLREPLLEGAWRLLDMPEVDAEASADVRSRSGRGRPRALSAQDRARARELYGSGEYSAAEVAESLGVSRATAYRYLKSEA